MTNPMSTLYPELVSGNYDCVDRIVLNAYFRLGHSAGGFRFWWQRLTGSEETLDNAHLMRMAGRFSRRVRGWAQAHQIPVIDCSVGERKHEIAEEQLEKTKVTRGVFVILSVGLRLRFGRSCANITWSARSRCPTSIITRFIFSTPTGGM